MFLNLCEELNIPISEEKTEWGATIVTFLGVLLDGKNFCLGLPLEKQERAVYMLEQIKDKRKATVKDLQVLCGFLNFIDQVVFPGRMFTRRMYSKFSSQMKLLAMDRKPRFQVQNKQRFKLKQHHHVRLDVEFKKDCETWLSFLTSTPLSEVVCRPMVDLFGLIQTSKEIEFYSDLSASKMLGFGCLLKSKWIQGFWGKDFIQENQLSIEYLELFALTAGILTWQAEPELCNCRITVFCDNQVVIHMINNGMVSSCRNCMHLLRMLVLNGLRWNR